MKTRHFNTISLCLLVILSLLTSCSGYNTQMRKHLSDEANYHPYRGMICDVYYFDEEGGKVSLLQRNEIPQRPVVLELAFDDLETVRTFLGGEPDPERMPDEYRFSFYITEDNSRILADHGFYTFVSVNTPVEIMASSYIYMDTDFFWIAAVTCDERTCLPFDDGLQNIRDYMNEHKSLT